MPVYNEAAFVEQAVVSLLGQTFADFELIISDNASTDGTQSVCEKCAEGDKRVRYYRQPANTGPMNNFKFVLGEARGEYFMWASGDDRWSPLFLEKLVKAIGGAGAIGAFGPFCFVDMDGNPKSRVISIDCSSRYRFVRLLKFTFFYNDMLFYGLFKKEAVRNVQFTRWWWINRTVAYNAAYPFIYQLLAIGDVKAVGGDPLLFKRMKTTVYHGIPASVPFVLRVAGFALRKFNLMVSALRGIYRVSGSPLLVAGVFPFLFLRFIAALAYGVFENLKRAFKIFP